MRISRLEINVDESDFRISSSTSKGNQSKWFKDNKWIKQNYLGYEDIAEWAVSELILPASSLSKDVYVNYELCEINMNHQKYNGCYSRNFLKKGSSLITLYRLFNLYNIDLDNPIVKNRTLDYKIKYTVESVYKITNLDITDYLSVLITLDAFIINEDRHFANIAFMRDPVGNYQLTPIFDNGLSLLSDMNDYPLRKPLHLNIYSVKSKMFSASFDAQLDILGTGFTIDEQKLMESIELYRDDLGRAYEVIKFQMNRYKGRIIV